MQHSMGTKYANLFFCPAEGKVIDLTELFWKRSESNFILATRKQIYCLLVVNLIKSIFTKEY